MAVHRGLPESHKVEPTFAPMCPFARKTGVLDFCDLAAVSAKRERKTANRDRLPTTATATATAVA